jgi:uncharacterized protein with NRDE domain
MSPKMGRGPIGNRPGIGQTDAFDQPGGPPDTLTPVCLLIFAWHDVPAYPLIVAANRDEQLDRPAHSLTVLREQGPRTLGGRDDLAGGTWLAVNEHGVVAGLTNRPSPGGRDLTKRSRGELPLMAAAHRTADEGVAALAQSVLPGQYNPAWLLVGDRESLYYVELTVEQPLSFRRLSPGIHVLENVALGEPSPKVDRVRSQLTASESTGGRWWEALPSVLADHAGPASVDTDASGTDAVVRPPATLASCVHTDDYGTRSAAVILVPAQVGGLPEVLVADGPPCTTPFGDVTDRWVA